MTTNGSTVKRITSLDGLKAIMMVLIFCWHTPYNPNSPVGEPIADIGARMCEVLFVASGFLVGYRYYNRPMPATIKQSWSYVSGKIAKIWPLHFITFLVAAVYLAKADPKAFFTLSNAFNAVINLLLLQAWSADPLSFNGVAWFISALMFCYFMAPLLMAIFRKSRRVIVSTLIGCIALRIALELASLHGAHFISIDFHFFPPIRCLEFFIGMLMVPAYFTLRTEMENSDIKHSMALLTAAEVLVSAAYTWLIISMEGKWIRGYFVLAACVLVFVFAMNGGVLSRFLSLRPFALFAVIQLEFFLLHDVVIRTLAPVLSIGIRSVMVQSVILFFITVALAALYDRYLKERLTKI